MKVELHILQKKMFNIKTQIHYVLILLSLGALFNSCGGHKEFVYFTEIQKDSVTKVKVYPKEAPIAKGDILQITVSETDELVLRQINGAAVPGATTQGPTYLVNDTGIIKFPLVGNIKAAGMWKDQLADTIRQRLITLKYLLNPVVNVRLVSFKVTVLGEVMRPGVIPVPGERITIIDAISQAGDLTIFANRSNVLLIREKDGKRIYKRIDLTQNDIFDSEYYYLENKDIVYVEPTKKKAASLDRSAQFYTMFLSTLSIVVLLYTQFAN